MSKSPGRDAAPAMERVLTLLATLADRPRNGWTTSELVERCGFDAADPDDRSRRLNRELSYLRSQGWMIENIGRRGEEARYRLTAGDNRLRVRFTAAQRVALRRAAAATHHNALVRHLEDAQPELPSLTVRVVPSGAAEDLDALLRAVTHRCRVDFDYKGSERSVHPYSVQSGASGWYLVGREDSSDTVKTFAASRMTAVRVGAPFTAEPAPTHTRASLDPLGWEIDPPVEVTVLTMSEHRALVDRLLGMPIAIQSVLQQQALTYRVTHRAAFRARLYELGPRVRVEGPADFRADMLDELTRSAS